MCKSVRVVGAYPATYAYPATHTCTMWYVYSTSTAYRIMFNYTYVVVFLCILSLRRLHVKTSLLFFPEIDVIAGMARN